MNKQLPKLLSAFLGILTLLGTGSAWGQVNFSGSYTQDFNTLASSGVDNSWTNGSTLNGWFLYNFTGSSITTYDAGDGNSLTGSFYSFGPATGSTTDRALGGLGSGGTYFGSPVSGAVAGYIAFAATNTTGTTITSLSLSFNGEQWRDAGNTTAQTMELEYGFGNTFATVSTWNAPGGNFNWTSPRATAIAGVVDGNSAGRVSNVGGQLPVSWAPNTTLWIRWIERNDAGFDHGLAIDDFSLSAPVPQPDLSPGISTPSPLWVNIPFNYTLDLYNNGTGNASGIALRFTLPANVTFNSANILGGGFSAPTLNGSVLTFTGGSVNAGSFAQISVNVTPTQAGTLDGATLEVDPDNTIAESKELNNLLTASTFPVRLRPTVNLSVNANTGTEAGQTVITVTATASGTVLGNQTVSLAVTGTGITAGDYSLSNSTITIPHGKTTGSVTFTITDDAIKEGLETAVLTISNPSSGLTMGSTVSQNITIIDNTYATLSGSSIICSGQSATLTASVENGTAPYNLTISNGTTNLAITNYTSGQRILVSPTASATYTIIALTDANGMPARTSALSGTAIVTVKPQLVAFTPLVVADGVLSCASPTVNLVAQGGIQYSFSGTGIISQGDGRERVVIGDYILFRRPIPTIGRAVVSQPGTYTVVVTSENGCSVPVTVVVSGEACPSGR